MTTDVQTYVEQSQIYLRQAFEELAVGDLRQASEKGWGAAAQMVKAAAEQQGWPHRGHRALFDAVGAIVAETNDSNYRRLLSSANDLHINFYDEFLNAEGVEARMMDVRLLGIKLSRYRGRNGAE